MLPRMIRPIASAALLLILTGPVPAPAPNRVSTTAGSVEGAVETDGLRVFKGVPFAAPPVGKLRWQPPQPPAK